jgi:hypothetical protein
LKLAAHDNRQEVGLANEGGSIMSKNNTTSNAEKSKQEKGSVPNGDTQQAAGGELHQIAGGEHPVLTPNQGVALSDNQNSLRANPQGPTLLEDFILREKITHFDHERIPERIVHARATGAHGLFELTDSLKQHTTARILTFENCKSRTRRRRRRCQQSRRIYCCGQDPPMGPGKVRSNLGITVNVNLFHSVLCLSVYERNGYKND